MAASRSNASAAAAAAAERRARLEDLRVEEALALAACRSKQDELVDLQREQGEVEARLGRLAQLPVHPRTRRREEILWRWATQLLVDNELCRLKVRRAMEELRSKTAAASRITKERKALEEEMGLRVEARAGYRMTRWDNVGFETDEPRDERAEINALIDRQVSMFWLE